MKIEKVYVSKGGMIFIGVTDLSQMQQRPSPGLTLRKLAWADAEAASSKFDLESLRSVQVTATRQYVISVAVID